MNKTITETAEVFVKANEQLKEFIKGLNKAFQGLEENRIKYIKKLEKRKAKKGLNNKQKSLLKELTK